MNDMKKTDRADLIRIAKARARHAKDEADQRASVLLSEIEDLMAAEFDVQDELWHHAVKAAEEAARRANEEIRERCAELGIPEQYAPSVDTGWRYRSRSLNDKEKRAELRKVAQARVKAMTATAKTMIDRRVLDVEEQLLVGGLASSEARAFVEKIPNVEELMPSLGLEDLGVKHWQPPEGVAAALLTPSTTADLKRRKVRRAIEANPAASNRKIAELVGVDHKTVAKYRPQPGEVPGEFPGHESDVGTSPEDPQRSDESEGGGRRG